MKHNPNDTSWETSASWYDKAVGAKGHYYHQQVIIPGILKLLDLHGSKNHSLLDLACGQGILSRQIPKDVPYTGVDLSRSLIEIARQHGQKQKQSFHIHDLCQPLKLQNQTFSHATCILALQNLENPLVLFQSAKEHLKEGGRFVIILNHPSFRIPRQSQWGVDPEKKLQYRRLDLYMSSLKIPIQTHPSQKDHSPHTWSFHRPLSFYSAALKQAGFLIEEIQEWCSDKKSIGKMAGLENRSRKEFPLFLALSCKKA